MAPALRLSLVAALIGLTACDTIGNPIDALSEKRRGPDEFAVISRAPLAMPPSAQLPTPTPGAASPLDPQPQQAAILALTGGASVPATRAATTSTGEAVLLSSANAAAASSEIRVQLEQDRITAAENEPYEPPSILELISGGDENAVDEATLLDPNDESRRLQSAGINAPVNPFERPETGPIVREDPGFSYDDPTDRRPTNRLPNRGAEAAAEEATE
ncbi:MAG: DUF3035 domain-containing protein [Pseudomonadota bacterium]